jgi:hypothetical protein
MLRAYVLSFAEGGAAERVGIGFGSGGIRGENGGGRLPDDGHRTAQTRFRERRGRRQYNPRAAVGAAPMLATANPAGLIISSGVKAYGEARGSSTVEGRAKATAKEIAAVLKQRFQAQGWIP